MIGIITDIQRASTVDGPGLRTTVFLKGCPLRCQWCHNPETQQRKIQLAFDPESATADDLTRIGLRDQPTADMSAEQISGILARAESCDPKSLVQRAACGGFFFYGREESVDAIINIVERDRAYYDRTGGGMTVSGGEPMAQPEFTLELLHRARSAGVHTALDTTGVTSLYHLERTLRVTDVYLFDYKATDSAKHQRLTGVPVWPVLTSLDWLCTNGARVILRCPMIPGVNDDTDHLSGIAELSRSYSAITSVEILTWHTMGQSKYRRLGIETDPQLPKDNTSEDQKVRYHDLLSGFSCRAFTIK